MPFLQGTQLYAAMGYGQNSFYMYIYIYTYTYLEPSSPLKKLTILTFLIPIQGVMYDHGLTEDPNGQISFTPGSLCPGASLLPDISKGMVLKLAGPGQIQISKCC